MRKHDYNMEVFLYEGDWICAFPDLPGCSGVGDTPMGAVANGLEAQALWLETYFETHKTYPRKKTEQENSCKTKMMNLIETLIQSKKGEEKIRRLKTGKEEMIDIYVIRAPKGFDDSLRGFLAEIERLDF